MTRPSFAHGAQESSQTGKHIRLHGIGKKIKSWVEKEENKLHNHHFRHFRSPHKSGVSEAKDTVKENNGDVTSPPPSEKQNFERDQETLAAAAEPGGGLPAAGQAPNAPIPQRKKMVRQFVDGGRIMSTAADLSLGMQICVALQGFRSSSHVVHAEQIHTYDGDREQIDRFPTSRTTFPCLSSITAPPVNPTITFNVTSTVSYELTPWQVEAHRTVMKELVVFHAVTKPQTSRAFAPNHPVRMYGQRKESSVALDAIEEETDEGMIKEGQGSQSLKSFDEKGAQPLPDRPQFSLQISAKSLTDADAPSTMNPFARRSSYLHRTRRVTFPDALVSTAPETDPTNHLTEPKSHRASFSHSLLPIPAYSSTVTHYFTHKAKRHHLPSNFAGWKSMYHINQGEYEVSAPATGISFPAWVSHDPDAADKHEHCFVASVEDEEFIVRSMKEVHLGNKELKDQTRHHSPVKGTEASEIGAFIAETFSTSSVIDSLTEKVEEVGNAIDKIVGMVKNVGSRDNHTVQLRKGDVQEEIGKDTSIAKMAS
ncbi:hypothetical protein HK097_001370 [Rhizophlyctis rosea]|uniref:Uncharacterized protein n=1 Tax=Rhizophlyctis rosea TaxID=64517 RepID=A0AAD5SJ25_9FUNG|nr:hypothetical protein HK097_001370 [Rhizophlyctis rosea]